MTVRQFMAGFWPRALVLCTQLMAADFAWSGEIRIAGGPQRTVMIELFTSQGCNSCPPAERYLNTYVDHPKLWTAYVPVAFHVDYWDYLGWRDRFADPRHTTRQRRYAELRHLRTVYTPAFVVNGRTWGLGFLRGEPQIEAEHVGVLELMVNGQQVSATFEPDRTVSGTLDFHLALLGMNLSTRILAGENKGRVSRHEFVAVGHKQTRGTGHRWRVGLPKIKVTPADRLALVAWISEPGDPTPIQAAGGYLPITLLR